MYSPFCRVITQISHPVIFCQAARKRGVHTTRIHQSFYHESVLEKLLTKAPPRTPHSALKSHSRLTPQAPNFAPSSTLQSDSVSSSLDFVEPDLSVANSSQYIPNESGVLDGARKRRSRRCFTCTCCEFHAHGVRRHLSLRLQLISQTTPHMSYITHITSHTLTTCRHSPKLSSIGAL